MCRVFSARCGLVGPDRIHLFMRTTAAIALGSNLGDRRRAIALGIRRINQLNTTTVTRISTIIETDPVGPPGQGPYMNAVILMETELSARVLLNELLAIEINLGRDRSGGERWGPRIIDLDILLYAQESCDEPGLVIPHPRMHERSFVLIPLCEIAPEYPVPPHKQTPRAMLRALHEA